LPLNGLALSPDSTDLMLSNQIVVESWIPLCGNYYFCGADNFQIADNETSSLYQLSIKHKTYIRHEFSTQLIPSA
jgi:hypothetical protein